MDMDASSFSSLSARDSADAHMPILNVTIVLLSFIDTGLFTSAPYSGPAISLAMEHLEKKYSRMRFKLEYVYDPDYITCENSRERMVGMTAEWYYRKRNKQDVTVFIESACVDNTDLPYFQTQWDTLWISTTATPPKIRNRRLHPTWICTSNFFLTGCSEFYLDILNKFNWTSVSIILASPNTVYPLIAGRLISDLASGKSIAYTVYRLTTTQEYPYGHFDPILGEIRNTSRVVLFFGYGSILRQLMVTAAAMNMTDGEYAYLAVEYYQHLPLNWQNDDGNDAVAFQAFQSLLLIHPSDYVPNGYTNTDFEQNFLAKSRRDFNFTYQPSYQTFIQLRERYLTITALGKVLNESLSDGSHSYRSGTALARYFLNQTFSDTSSDTIMYIDGEGQRRTSFTLSRFTVSGSREPFLEKLGRNGKLVEIFNLTTWVNGTFPPPNKPTCGYSKEDCLPAAHISSIYAILFPLLGLAMILGVALLEYARRRYNAQDPLSNSNWWQIKLDQSPAPLSQVSVQQVAMHSDPRKSVEAHTSIKKLSVAMYNHNKVICIRLVERSQSVTSEELSANKQLLILLRKLHRMEHLNICRFIGLTITETERACCVSAVTECPTKGALPDIFESRFIADPVLANSLIRDFLDAVIYIHTSPLQYHGRIAPLACRIDKHFTLMVIRVAIGRMENELMTACKDIKIYSHDPAWESPYWFGPEEPHANDAKAWQVVDICSSAMIVYDILTAGSLYKKLAPINGTIMRKRDLLLQDLDFSKLTSIKAVIISCWNADPPKRPDINQLRSDLAQAIPGLLDGRGRTLFEKVHRRLIQYSADLEHQVAVRTLELKDEMHKCDVIISQFLPRTILKQLRQGGIVLPEFFDGVTVMFTDLVGFQDFVKGTLPHAIISLIAETEACIDRLSTACDVYKVEAIGDSFMVASGVPDRHGEEHVTRIANFALRLRDMESQLGFLGSLQFRTGFHSGSCAAGLMGLKRPRYCLFGDTINMASRMCSHGMQGHIHISADSQQILKKFPEFLTASRGVVAIKGKSEIMTYWLVGLRCVLDLPNTLIPKCI